MQFSHQGALLLSVELVAIFFKFILIKKKVTFRFVSRLMLVDIFNPNISNCKAANSSSSLMNIYVSLCHFSSFSDYSFKDSIRQLHFVFRGTCVRFCV